MELKSFSDLAGQTLRSIERCGGPDEGEELIFALENGDQYKLHHDQECCETVVIEDIAGDLNDLVGTPITKAEEVSNQDSRDPSKETDESFTWTFYHLATIKGYVTIRWLGTSNGYYSESVYFVKC